MKNKLAVLLPILNQLSMTKTYLRFMFKNNPEFNYQLIFIDNCSNDGTLEYLTDKFIYDNKFVVRCSQNMGIATSWNMGAGIARAEYLCFIGTDVLVPPNFFKIALDLLDENPDISGASPDYMVRKILPEWESKLNTLPKPELKRKIENDFRMKKFCFFIRKQAYNELGGFDESLQWNEDLDFNVRLNESGFKTARLANLLVYHFEGKSLIGASESIGDENFKRKWGDKLNDKLKNL